MPARERASPGNSLPGINYRFSDSNLLEQALTHRSAAASNNERLEYLGDAVLGLFVADALFQRFPDADEGQLTRARASLVNRASLARIARRITLGDFLKLGEGELRSGGWRRDSILANALEAVVGAVYLDGGIGACERMLAAWFQSELDEVQPDALSKDPKTRLQEWLQGRGAALPVYETSLVEGDSHNQVFTVECRADGLDEPAIATGTSRRRAEQAAAAAALARLTGGDEDD
jgi:ribonuclease-3